MDVIDEAQVLVDKQEAHRMKEFKKRTAGSPAVFTNCQECGENINPARREALPGVSFCIDCQAMRESCV